MTKNLAICNSKGFKKNTFDFAKKNLHIKTFLDLNFINPISTPI